MLDLYNDPSGKDIHKIDLTGVTELLCYRMKLTSLPHLPSTLTHLWCHNNKLTSLPPLPQSLTHLYCHNNQLTSLPELPLGMKEIYCQYNQLTDLPDLPFTLEKLWYHKNQGDFIYAGWNNIRLQQHNNKRIKLGLNKDLTKI